MPRWTTWPSSAFSSRCNQIPHWTVVVSICRHIRTDPRGTLPHRWPPGSKEALEFRLSPFKHIRIAASWSCPGDTFAIAVVQVSLTDTDLFTSCFSHNLLVHSFHLPLTLFTKMFYLGEYTYAHINVMLAVAIKGEMVMHLKESKDIYIWEATCWSLAAAWIVQ